MRIAIIAALGCLTMTTGAAAMMGSGDTPQGTFCRVQAVCVIAQNEGDCRQIDGAPFPTHQACKEAGATPQGAPAQSNDDKAGGRKANQ